MTQIDFDSFELGPDPAIHATYGSLPAKILQIAHPPFIRCSHT